MTLEKVIKILAEYKECDATGITADTTFADLELDSLDTVDLMMAVEDEFGMELELDENTKSVGGLCALIEQAQA